VGRCSQSRRAIAWHDELDRCALTTVDVERLDSAKPMQLRKRVARRGEIYAVILTVCSLRAVDSG